MLFTVSQSPQFHRKLQLNWLKPMVLNEIEYRFTVSRPQKPPDVAKAIKLLDFREMTGWRMVKNGRFWPFLVLRVLVCRLLRRVVDEVLLQQFGDGVKVAEEIADDCGERSIAPCGPNAGFVVDAGWNGDGDVLGHASFL